MAERRMFAKTIIDSDAFLNMPLSTQALYFHLSMRADDDGFINNPKKIMRMVNASEDDLRMLTFRNFIITFESGVIVIKHWRIHNYIRNDRYKETVYQDEKSMLNQKDNGSYTTNKSVGLPLGIPDGNQMETQVRLGKVRKGKVSKEKDIDVFESFAKDNNLLLKALIDFEEFRKEIKKPLTYRAKELLVEGLKQMSSEGEDIIACINQSIMNRWLGVFPVKEGFKNAGNKKSDRQPTDDWGIKTNRL